MISREWFAVRTKPHQEFVAQYNFQRQNFHSYLPKIVKTVKHARKIRKVTRPYFPGYLFLYLSPSEQDWNKISSTKGSLGPVKFGDHYPAVPDLVIEELVSRENENGHIPLDIQAMGFHTGQKVLITTTEFDNIQGLFLEMKDEQRAIILLNMLQRQVKTTVELDLLQAV